jgi:hypothetical protein
MPLISSDLDGRPQERRRLGYFAITPAAFKALFQRGEYHSFSVLEGIPENAVYAGAEYLAERKEWRVYFEHDDFTEIWEASGQIPEYPIALHHIGEKYGDD